ncbi:MAG TPA: hypothetical protein VNZ53_34300 [Steroidobacteraceae bacterium]|jgi:hypothetical protein|nr:hypothetical protein [Steroidobacteraceae bacterium]
MEIPKLPPVEVPAARAGTATTAATAQQGLPAAVNLAPLADRADIRPLDLAAALQILLAEVRAGLDLPADGAIPPSAIPQSPTQAARALVEIFLKELPEDAGNAPAWMAALERVETAMHSSIERAIGLVTLWPEVAAAVVDAVKEARALFLFALGPDRQNPLWLRPEWLGLGPRLLRFRRRRRRARRRLSDPDWRR